MMTVVEEKRTDIVIMMAEKKQKAMETRDTDYYYCGKCRKIKGIP